MAVTKGDVLTYLQGLPSQINRRFVIGQHAWWWGGSNNGPEIPALVAASGGPAPGLVADLWGDIRYSEDASHYQAVAMPNAIAALTGYWNAGGLIQTGYEPGHPITGLRFNATPDLNPPNVATLISGAQTCLSWRAGVQVATPYTGMLDYHAAYLAQLRDAGVMVIYRMYPEMDRKGVTSSDSPQWHRNLSPADYIALWQFTRNYLVTTKGLTNLLFLWACIQDGPSTCLQWYPGSAYVDLVGFDHYPPDGVMLTHPVYTQLLTLGKPVVLGEFGLQGPGDTVTVPRDINTMVERVRANMPQLVAGACWDGIWALGLQSNVPAGMANNWLVTQPVPVLQLAPVASFTATAVPGTRTIQFQDTSV